VSGNQSVQHTDHFRKSCKDNLGIRGLAWPITLEELYRTIAEIIAFAWNLKGKFPEGHDPQAPRMERDVTDRGEDY
jgi:flagellar biosynthesis protein